MLTQWFRCVGNGQEMLYTIVVEPGDELDIGEHGGFTHRLMTVLQLQFRPAC